MIDEYTYGCFVVQGKQFLGDLKIQNNKPHYWQELTDRKLRTDHINSLLLENPDVFIIGTGAGGLLDVDEIVRNHLQLWVLNSRQKPQYHILKNIDAIKLVNKSIEQGQNVCAVLAGGC